MAVSKTPPSAWTDAALAALAAGGPDAVRVESIAAALGVSKGGFYWHFANRQDLLDRMLTAWEQAVVDAVITTVEGQHEDPREKLRELLEIALAFGLAGQGIEVEVAIRDWARRDPVVAERLRAVDERRVDYLRGLFGQLSAAEEDAEARCLLAYALFVGNPLIAFEHPGATRAEVIRRAFELLLV